jgi:hypothetical protein
MVDIPSVPGTVETVVPPELMGALHKQADVITRQYEHLAKQINKLSNIEGNDMADTILTGGDSSMGMGGGLIGGLILGSLLRNNGNLFGGNGDGTGGGLATQGGVQNVVNQSAIQQELADIKASIPFNEAQVQLALAQAQSSLTSQINQSDAAAALRDAGLAQSLSTGFGQQNLALANSLASITSDVRNVGNAVQASTYATSQVVRDDGDKTRALITSQYQDTLNRQLSEANNALAELRGNERLSLATRGIEVNTTNNINQMQQQQQQQQQYAQLANLVYGLSQQIRSTNEAINVGSGTLTASPTNTNTNIR